MNSAKLILGLVLLVGGMASNTAVAQHFLGIQTANNLSLPNSHASDLLEDQFLLRYSIGLMGRSIIKDNWKFRLVAPVRKGVVAFDYGFNFVFSGFQYQLGDVQVYADHLSLEVPLLLNFYDSRNIFIPRKWIRKGLTTYIRLGIKPSFAHRKDQARQFMQGNEILDERFEQKPFNLLAAMDMGLICNQKNGHSFFLGLGLNLGLIPQTVGRISYENSETSTFEYVSYVQ